MQRKTRTGQWTMAAWAGLTVLGMAGAAHAETPRVTIQSVFRLPAPEAVGAAIGAIGAVQIAARLKSRKKDDERTPKKR